MQPKDLSTDTLGALFDQSTDCVKLLDPEGRVVWMNTNGQTIMEIEDFCAVEGEFWAEFWPEDHRETIEATMAEGADSSTHRFRAACPTAKGTQKFWDVSVSPVVSTTEEHAGFLAISRDISGEAEARAALEMALSEMRHRLTNAFATATSLLRVHAKGTKTAEALAGDVSERLNALAAVQTLFHGTEGPVRLGQIVSTLLAPFDATRSEIEIGNIPDLAVGGMTGDSVALVMGELCIHSSHGGAFGHGGMLSIAGRMDGDDLILDWTETVYGDDLPDDWQEDRGLRLMQRILEGRKDSLSLSFEDKTLTASLRLTIRPRR